MTSSRFSFWEHSLLPVVSGSTPARILSNVDLPAPFGPIKPNFSPLFMCRVRPLKRLDMPKSLDASIRLISFTKLGQFVDDLNIQRYFCHLHQLLHPFQIYEQLVVIIKGKSRLVKSLLILHQIVVLNVQEVL